MPERLDKVQIEVGDRIVELPWDVADDLKARALHAAPSFRQKMDAVGASRPATIADAAELRSMLDVVRTWINETTDQAIPDSVRTLRNALVDEQDRIAADARATE